MDGWRDGRTDGWDGYVDAILPVKMAQGQQPNSSSVEGTGMDHPPGGLV